MLSESMRYGNPVSSLVYFAPEDVLDDYENMVNTLETQTEGVNEILAQLPDEDELYPIRVAAKELSKILTTGAQRQLLEELLTIIDDKQLELTRRAEYAYDVSGD